MATIDERAQELCRLSRDAAYVTIGFGILAFQRLQVRRHELTRALGARRAQLEQTARRVVGQALGRPERRDPDASATAA